MALKTLNGWLVLKKLPVVIYLKKSGFSSAISFNPFIKSEKDISSSNHLK